MAEIQLVRIKPIYGEIKGYLEGLPKEGSGAASGPWVIPVVIARKFNDAIDALRTISSTDYSRLKISYAGVSGETLNIREVKPIIHAAVCSLEEEFGFGRSNGISTPAIIIYNKNQNEISVQVNYSLSQLIKESDDESRDKLRQLEDELNKPQKNWEVIKPILIWILNFSKELFIKIIPIILEKKI